MKDLILNAYPPYSKDKIATLECSYSNNRVELCVNDYYGGDDSISVIELDKEDVVTLIEKLIEFKDKMK